MTRLMRWDPFSEISRLQSDLDRLWGDTRRGGFTPAVDIFEEDDGIVMKAEVPGMKAEDLHVHVENGVLTLSGERSLENEETKDRYHRVERAYGAFSRSFVLPKTVDGEAIDASLDAGVLTLRLPKKQTEEKRRIEIKAS
jgi:HSP20 family protein